MSSWGVDSKGLYSFLSCLRRPKDMVLSKTGVIDSFLHTMWAAEVHFKDPQWWKTKIKQTIYKKVQFIVDPFTFSGLALSRIMSKWGEKSLSEWQYWGIWCVGKTSKPCKPSVCFNSVCLHVGVFWKRQWCRVEGSRSCCDLFMMTNKWLTWAGDTLKLDLRWGNVCMCVTLSKYDFHFEVIIQNKEPSILKITHLRLFIVFQIHNPIYTLICGSVEWRQCKRRANHVNETYRWHVKKMERWLSKICRCNQNYNSQFCILMGLNYDLKLSY